LPFISQKAAGPYADDPGNSQGYRIIAKGLQINDSYKVR